MSVKRSRSEDKEDDRFELLPEMSKQPFGEKSIFNNFFNSSRITRSRSATSFRRSVRASGKSADSGYGISDGGPNYHSDTELR